MKKRFSIFFIAFVLSVLVVVPTFAYTVGATLVTANVNDPDQATATGYVHIENDGQNIYVKYWMKAGYCLEETHLEIATDLALIPQNSGGATPGQFTYKTDHTPCAKSFTYVIPFADVLGGPVAIGNTVFIAAHGVVRYPDGTTTETGWGARCGCLWQANFPGSNWSAYIVYPIHAH